MRSSLLLWLVALALFFVYVVGEFTHPISFRAIGLWERYANIVPELGWILASIGLSLACIRWVGGRSIILAGATLGLLALLAAASLVDTSLLAAGVLRGSALPGSSAAWDVADAMIFPAFHIVAGAVVVRAPQRRIAYALFAIAAVSAGDVCLLCSSLAGVQEGYSELLALPIVFGPYALSVPGVAAALSVVIRVARQQRRLANS